VPGEDLTGEGRLLNQTIEVNVVGDGLSEIDETFLVVLSNPTGSVILDGEGLGTITNDDDPPIFITIDDVSIMEGDSGTTDFTFAVSLSAAGSGPISVDFATENGTATAGVNKDYRKINKDTLTFAAGDINQTITVLVNGDVTPETYETFFVNLTNADGAIISDDQGLGTILDDDGALRMAEATHAQTSTNLLDAAQVEPVLAAAIRRWDASGVDTSALANVGIQIETLPGQEVGRVSGNTIILDPTAAGHGWFIDSSVRDDSEFATPGNQGELNRMDLLTVVMHEVGHLLGMEHTADADDLMATTLAVGVRTLPTPYESQSSNEEVGERNSQLPDSVNTNATLDVTTSQSRSLLTTSATDGFFDSLGAAALPVGLGMARADVSSNGVSGGILHRCPWTRRGSQYVTRSERARVMHTFLAKRIRTTLLTTSLATSEFLKTTTAAQMKTAKICGIWIQRPSRQASSRSDPKPSRHTDTARAAGRLHTSHRVVSRDARQIYA